MKTKILVLMMVAGACLASCSSEAPTDGTNGLPDLPADTPEKPLEPGEPAKPRQDIALTPAEQAIAAGNNAFAFDLLRTAIASDGEDGANKNRLLSPLSLTLALTMLDNGAGGVTHDEIRSALGFGDASRDDVNGYFRKMVDALAGADNRVTFESANSLWIADRLTVYDAFKAVNREAFDAETFAFDSNDPADAMKRINKWCAAKTHDLIPRLLDKPYRDIVMYLVNALYFKAGWTHRFDRVRTARSAFHNLDGSTSGPQTMRQTTNLNYLATDAFEMVELPYGNESFALALLLPAKNTTAATVIDALDAETWNDCLARLRRTPVDIRLPRFKVEYARPLNDDLKALGMTTMFGPAADFPLISPQPLAVSLVLQKTFITVDEEGSEAAAATVIGMVESAGEPLPQPVVLAFDRPFVYFIKEKSTGSIIFAGAIENL
jgi:serpin B